MTNRFLLITLVFHQNPKVSELEPVFSAIGDDWYRLSALNWILWTPKPAIHVLTLLRGHLDPEDNVLITRIITGSTTGKDMIGWLNNGVWRWLNSRDANTQFKIGKEVEALARLPASAIIDDAEQ